MPPTADRERQVDGVGSAATHARLSLLATTAAGIAPLLVEELATMGIAATESGHGVRFQADLAAAYRCLLGSRLASRLLLPLARFELTDAEACHTAASAIDWGALFDVEASFAVEVSGRSPAVAHSHFAALRVKDAVADHFRAACGRRPDVDRDDPEVRLLLQLRKEHAELHLDIGHGPLHRRGYRVAGGAAPLRENLAAALLWRAGWPTMAASGGAFLDPFCGSGTLVIEAALMATCTAPGLLREFQPHGWKGHRPELWQAEREAARGRLRPWRAAPLRGSDRAPEAVAAARANARRAGVAEITDFGVAEALSCTPGDADSGLLMANPPYGERVGEAAELVKLYSLFGEHLKRRFGGWRVALLLADDSDSQRLGLRAEARHRFRNGPIDCQLLQFAMHAGPPRRPAAPEFANRLAKRQRHLARWARRRGVDCYRVYDADLAEYPLLIDRYVDDDGEVHLHVQEFAAPQTVAAARAEARLRAALQACCEVLELPASRLHYKLRRPQKRGAQYSVQADESASVPLRIREHGCHLLVDLGRYLDTGLFLDHRPMRLQLQQECQGLRLLNLFCYTAAASVHAAVGGARQTVSVDLSNTYLAWAARNFAANGLRAETVDGRGGGRLPEHALVRDDCQRWLLAAKGREARFDRIFCDPPTFSNSKRNEADFDVQRDHPALIHAAADLLADDGVLYFSCNRRRFRLDEAALSGLRCEDITARTLDEDFRRPPPAHRCWRISRQP